MNQNIFQQFIMNYKRISQNGLINKSRFKKCPYCFYDVMISLFQRSSVDY